MRYDRRTKLIHRNVINFGMSKGLTFERTLLYPTGKIKTALAENDISECGAKAKFYVALTRAKHSVAIVYNGQTEIDGIVRYSYD
jgi:DNA helicase-2/ATP-dependent DNA helicase PcrA